MRTAYDVSWFAIDSEYIFRGSFVGLGRIMVMFSDGVAWLTHVGRKSIVTRRHVALNAMKGICRFLVRMSFYIWARSCMHISIINARFLGKLFQ
jgi:hypothetical protein